MSLPKLTLPRADARYTRVVKAPTGTAATDIAAFQAAHDALPSTGGTIVFGRGDYNITTGITISKPVVIEGQGRGDFTLAAPTRLYSTATTGSAIQVTAHGVSFKDIAVVNTSGTAPTAGRGIYFTAGDGANLTRAKVAGFFNNVEFEQGRYQQFTDTYFFDTVNYGLYLKNSTAGQGDFGDCIVQGCTFASYNTSRVSQAACRWESGGGLKFLGNKTNGNYATLGQSQIVGLHAAVVDGCSTSVLVVTGNSFEGIQAGGAPLVVTQVGTGTGSFSKVVITSNEGLAGAGYRIIGLVTGAVSNVLIANNLYSSNNPGVYLKNCSQVTVGKNRHMGLATGAAAVEVSTGVTDYTVEPQDVDNTGVMWLKDDSAVGTSSAKVGSIGTYSREIPATTSSVTYTDLTQIQFPQYVAAVAEFTLTGQVAGLGAFIWQGKRSIVQAAAGTTPTVTTIGTDTSTANAPTVLIDATVNQTVTARVRLPGSGSGIYGQITMRVDGLPSRVWKL